MAWVTGSKTCVDIMSSSGVTIEDIQRGQKREKERRRKEQTVNDQVMDITLGTCYKQVFVLIAVVAATVVAVVAAAAVVAVVAAVVAVVVAAAVVVKFRN